MSVLSFFLAPPPLFDFVAKPHIFLAIKKTFKITNTQFIQNLGTSGERLLYFHAMAGTTENAIPLRLVDNATIWDDNPDALPRSFVVRYALLYSTMHYSD